jgi:putative hydrolases of HD superfamily
VQTQARTGWVYRGVEKPESIADHMYRMAVMALTVVGSEYDQSKLVKMAIVHDIAEALVGDITPVDGISDEEKHARELAAVEKIQEMLGPQTLVAKELSELWCESSHT